VWVEDVAACIETFFATSDIGTLSIEPKDFIRAMDDAIRKVGFR
jgi:hypothetical protein